MEASAHAQDPAAAALRRRIAAAEAGAVTEVCDALALHRCVSETSMRVCVY